MRRVVRLYSCTSLRRESSTSNGQYKEDSYKGELGKNAFCARKLRLCKRINFAVWRHRH